MHDDNDTANCWACGDELRSKDSCMPPNLLQCILFSMAICLTPIVSIAGLPDQHSWRTTSPDGRYVLVVIANRPAKVEIEEQHGNTAAAEELRHLRAWYPGSGLYRNEGTAVPLWKLQDYMPEDYDVHISPDGKHAVFVGGSMGFVVCIYSSGRRLAWHLDQDFIPYYWSKFLINRLFGYGYGPVDYTAAGFDAEFSTFLLTTNQGERFAFDVATGKLLYYSSPWPWLIGMAMLLTPALIMFVWYRNWFRIRRVACKQTTEGVSHPAISGTTAHARRRRLSFTLRRLMQIITALGVMMGLAVTIGWRSIILFAVLLAGLLSMLFAGSSRSLWIGMAWGVYGAVDWRGSWGRSV